MKFGSGAKALDMLDDKEAPPSKEEASESEGVDAAKDILEAIAAKDATALDVALQRHYACCEGGDEGGYKASDEEA